MTCDLLDLRDHAAIRRLVREGITQGSANGMGGEVLDMGSEMKQLVLIAGGGMDSGNGKLAMSQRARLVEDHRRDLRQHVDIVGSLDEDTLPRGPANATKERQRHTDNQGTRTTHHEEHQGSVQPSGERG